MLSIGKLAPGPNPGAYYLARVGCPLEYFVGRGEAAGVWMGRGAAALRLSGAVDTPAAEQVLRGLLDGVGPDGSRLVQPVLRADPRSRVPAAAVVRSLTRAAEGADADVAALLVQAGSDQLLRAWQRAVREVEQARRRPRWPAPSLAAETAARLLVAVGLDATTELGERSPTGRFRDRLAGALRHREDRVDVRLPGLDLTLSAPKSVSVLFGLGGADGPAGGGGPAVLDVPDRVRAAHRAAVQASVDYLELTCTSALRGHHRGDDSDTRVATRGLIGVAFEHRSSRCGDPQLHTHVVVANLLHGVDGRWSALDTREIYAQARTAGFVYQAVLRGELTRTLGVRWGEVRNGQAEIVGLPVALLRLFSKRRQQIEAQLDLLGLQGPRAAQAAALATRPAKPARATAGAGPAQADGLGLRDRWQTEARAAGYPARVLDRALDQVGVPDRRRAAHGAAAVAGPVADQLSEALLGPAGLTLKRSTFDRRDLLRGVCEQLPTGTPVSLATLRALATRVLRDARVVPLLGPAAVRSRRYSTQELLVAERDAVNRAGGCGDAGAAIVPSAVLAAAAARARSLGLSQEQSDMLRRLLTSGAGVEVVVGAAGAGKTAALAVAAQAWRDAGLEVRGTALAAIAARVLEDSAAIPAVSLQRLLDQTREPRPAAATTLPVGGVLVVDEAGMVGTRTLHQLIALSQQRHTKLVLVGDPRQLPEIEAGGLFAALAARLPASTLRGNQRQGARWEQRALRELRDGDVLRALAAYAAHDRLRLTDSLGDLTSQLLADYQQAISQHAPEQVLVIAGSRGDARRLNARLRERLLTDGCLGPEELRIALTSHDGRQHAPSADGRERGFRRGEQVLVTANDYRRGLLNGTRGTVTDLDPGRQQLTVRLDDGRHVRLDADYLRTGRLAHGYALTAHKAQGVTVDVALLWGSHTLTRETGYVAMSRGRHANYLYATWDNLRHDTGDADLDRPALSARPDRQARRGLTRAALTERLGVSGRQRTARSWWRPRPASHGSTLPPATVPPAGEPARGRSA